MKMAQQRNDSITREKKEAQENDKERDTYKNKKKGQVQAGGASAARRRIQEREEKKAALAKSPNIGQQICNK